MKIIETGSTLRIFGDDLKTHDKIPTGTYKVAFHPMQGYWLERRKDFDAPKKIYGNHKKYAEKILQRYLAGERNFGAILGGRKGTGKSLTARLISMLAAENGIPTIIVDADTGGIVNFLESIEQPVMVLFDEFEKVFPDGKDGEDAQAKFLPLFDGVVNNKHLYIVTLNNYNRMNEYLIGRTGRFYYNFKFGSITRDELQEYITDTVTVDIDVKRMTNMLQRIDANYDQLTAITQELNYGEDLNTILEQVNLGLSTTLYEYYNVEVIMENGDTLQKQQRVNILDTEMDIYYDETVTVFENLGAREKHNYEFSVNVDTAFIDLDVNGNFTVTAENISVENDYNARVEDEPQFNDKGDIQFMDLTKDTKIRAIKFSKPTETKLAY